MKSNLLQLLRSTTLFIICCCYIMKYSYYCFCYCYYYYHPNQNNILQLQLQQHQHSKQFNVDTTTTTTTSIVVSTVTSNNNKKVDVDTQLLKQIQPFKKMNDKDDDDDDDDNTITHNNHIQNYQQQDTITKGDTTTATSSRTHWTKEMYPNPIIDPITCRYSTTTNLQQQQHLQSSLLCDPDEILTLNEIQVIQNKLYNTISLQQYHIKIHFVFLQKQMYRTNNNNSNNNSTFDNTAEDFARYIYQDWMNTGSNLYSDSFNTTTIIMRQTLSKKANTIQQQSVVDDWNLLVLIAKGDQMVYLARPSSSKQQHYPDQTKKQSKYTNTMVDNILTAARMERLLVYRMIPYLQKEQYVTAIHELIMGIDFFLLYGTPKFWERILLHLDQNDYHYEYILLYIIVTTTIVIGWTTHYFWMKHTAIRQQEQLRFYEEQNAIYNDNSSNNNSRDWLQKIDNVVMIHPLSPKEYDDAKQLRQQRYYTQDSCPICLEKLEFDVSSALSSSSTSNSTVSGSDCCNKSTDSNMNKTQTRPSIQQISTKQVQHESNGTTTLLRCGHICHMECWRTWLKYQYRQWWYSASTTGTRRHDDNKDNNSIKCLICQQSVDTINTNK